MHSLGNKDTNPPCDSLGKALLYGILDLGYVKEGALEQVAGELLEGGVDVMQLRAKGCSSDEVLKLIRGHAPNLVALCRAHAAPLIINDFPEVAVAVGADGVHIGQDDGSLAQVRGIVGGDMIVGRSTHSPEQAKEALEEGFDYIGFGPLFPTPTKKGRSGIGLESVTEVQKTIGARIPVFCIGGIKPDNLELVLASGARRVVIVSALLQAPDVSVATQEVVSRLNA